MVKLFWNNNPNNDCFLDFIDYNENLDATLFAKCKKWTKDKKLGVRNIFSDMPTLALDSLLFISIAFGGEFPLDVIWMMIWVNC